MRDWSTKFQISKSVVDVVSVVENENIKTDGVGLLDPSDLLQGENTIYKNSIFNNKYSDNIPTTTSTFPTTSTTSKIEKSTPAYTTQRMAELGLSNADVRSESDPSLALDEIELQEIRNDKQLFDIWVDHVHRHKQLKALEMEEKRRNEEYDPNATFESMPFEDKFKLTQHILTTFKKYFIGSCYKGEEPSDLFVEIWFLVNANLTIEQVINGAAKIIVLTNKYKKEGNNVEFNRLQKISENAERFREFCLSEMC